MNLKKYIRPFAITTIVIVMAILSPAKPEYVLETNLDDTTSYSVVVGSVTNPQGQPISHATIQAKAQATDLIIAETASQSDGSFILHLPEGTDEVTEIIIDRYHFQTVHILFEQEISDRLQSSAPVILDTLVLNPDINYGFWVAASVFAFVLGIIAMGKMQNVLAALSGVAILFAVSYIGSAWKESLYIFTFDEALNYIDWNVIFLILGMMIVIAIIEHTGIFQWLAFKAYQVSQGKKWLLLTILMLVTGVASAFLDNVTTMLLMAPITIQIALSLGVHPFTFIMPEIFASNVIGISTLVGTPTNILIGSYGDIGFGDFLINLTPGVLMSFVGLVVYSLVIYKKDIMSEDTEDISSLLYDELRKNAVISRPEQLRKAGWVGVGMLVLFVIGEKFHLLPSVTAIMGAVAMLVWIKPDIEEVFQAVDWTMLIFFIALFICVGAIQEVGAISIIAGYISQLVGNNLLMAILALVWFSAFLSTTIANIPFTAAMLPVIGYLTATVPGAESKVLFYTLSIGAAMGGNGSLIGASANMVAAGIVEKAGYPLSYGYFLKKGIPALIVTVSLATIWILIRFYF